MKRTLAHTRDAAAEAALLLAEVDGRPRVAAELRVRKLQELWSGLGSVLLIDDEQEHLGSVIVKEVDLPPAAQRDFFTQRDIDSYLTEVAFYQRHAPRLLAAPYSLSVPAPLLVRATEHRITICMTKLEGRPAAAADGDLSREEAHAALDALATLHAAFWGISPGELDGLQPQGSFWHLDSRALELAQMPKSGWERRLCLAARAIDERLKADGMQTCVHGDPKDANILFARRRAGGEAGRGGRGGHLKAQLFDFQYTGRAPPTKDLAYLFTCVAGSRAVKVESELLGHYHANLSQAMVARGLAPPSLSSLQASLELAYADLARWMSGWEGGWWAKPLLQARAKALLDKLDGGTALQDELAYVDAVFKRYPP